MSRILVIDSDPALLGLLRETLHDLGHEVLVANNAREGVLLTLFWHPVEVILTDMDQSDRGDFDWMKGIIQFIQGPKGNVPVKIMRLSRFYCHCDGSNVFAMARSLGEKWVMAKPRHPFVLRQKLKSSIVDVAPGRRLAWTH